VTGARKISLRERFDRIKAGEGFIYAAHFASCWREKAPFIKIGFSLFPHKRVYLALPASGKYRAPHLLGYVPGSLKDEHALHRALRGRPRINCDFRRGIEVSDSEHYPLSIIEHPSMPAGLIWDAAFVPNTRRAA
jgi:hypothetical protein